ncbi:hypothetical protein GCM10027037_28520 [Mucilaginibacter koreensis]
MSTPTNDSNIKNEAWPMPQFGFEVDFGTEVGNATFQEVSGLDVAQPPVEYQPGNKAVFSNIKPPGIAQVGNITLKRGIFVSDATFWERHSELSLNNIKRYTVTIKLLDATGEPLMQWQLQNAWPVKISGTDLKSDAHEVAVQTLEMAYEAMVVINE